MNKRGQATVFVIFGLVVILVIALIYVFSSGLIGVEPGTKNVQLRLTEVYDAIKKDQIDRCIDLETKDAIKDLIEGGGSFNPVNKIRYHGKDVTVLCQAIPEKNTCLSTPLFLNVLEEKLNKRLTERLSICIDLSAYQGKDYSVETGDLKANVSIYPKNVNVRVNYPITLRSGIVNFTHENFVHNVNVPLGEIIKIVNDILNSEAQFGAFEPLSYGLLSLNRYSVEVDKPYPNKIYTAGLTTSDYKMWFAITGSDRFKKT